MFVLTVEQIKLTQTGILVFEIQSKIFKIEFNEKISYRLRAMRIQILYGDIEKDSHKIVEFIQKVRNLTKDLRKKVVNFTHTHGIFITVYHLPNFTLFYARML